MHKYVQVSSDVFNLIEKESVNQNNCVITYFNQVQEKITVKSKVITIKNINNAEFMEIEDGSTIRLDKIYSFNDNMIQNINHY